MMVGFVADEMCRCLSTAKLADAGAAREQSKPSERGRWQGDDVQGHVVHIDAASDIDVGEPAVAVAARD